MKIKNKGFTLAELLIVVAIIAVLVAIAIPVFTSQLEKSREATDLANVRAAYAEVMVAVHNDDKSSALFNTLTNNYTATISLVQKVDGWTTHKDDYDTALVVGGCTYSDDENISRMINRPKAEGTCTVTYDTSTNLITIDWGGDPAESHTIDPNNSYSVGNGIFEYVLEQLTKYNNNETVDDKYVKLFKNGTTCDDTFTLPDGTKVQVSTFSRNYDSFEDIKSRIQTKDKATLVYNNSGQLSTIVYWNGTEWMCWQANKHDGTDPDYEGWKDESNWQKNTYTTYNQTTGLTQKWELKNGNAVLIKD